MDTYDEIYLKCSSMYINIRMSKSNITDSPDGNQLNVIDSSYEINKVVHFTIHSWLDIGYVPAGPHAFFRSSGHNNSFYAGPRGQWLSDRWKTHVPVFSVDVSRVAVRWFDLQVFSSTELFYLCVLV